MPAVNSWPEETLRLKPRRPSLRVNADHDEPEWLNSVIPPVFVG